MQSYSRTSPTRFSGANSYRKNGATDRYRPNASPQRPGTVKTAPNGGYLTSKRPTPIGFGSPKRSQRSPVRAKRQGLNSAKASTAYRINVPQDPPKYKAGPSPFKLQEKIRKQDDMMTQGSTGERIYEAPMPRKTQAALDEYFPGALTGAETERLVYKTLAPMGFTADNTLFCDCSCPDEINHDNGDEDISMLFQNRWGEVFPLSGLGGMPFTGKTGWAAMSSHVPVNGNIVVLIAPHVGIDKDGNVGKVTRKGQHGCSSACGAAIGALAALEADRSAGNFQNGYEDHQMDAIKHFLEPHVDEL